MQNLIDLSYINLLFVALIMIMRYVATSTLSLVIAFITYALIKTNDLRKFTKNRTITSKQSLWACKV